MGLPATRTALDSDFSRLGIRTTRDASDSRGAWRCPRPVRSAREQRRARALRRRWPRRILLQAATHPSRARGSVTHVPGQMCHPCAGLHTGTAGDSDCPRLGLPCDSECLRLGIPPLGVRAIREKRGAARGRSGVLESGVARGRCVERRRRTISGRSGSGGRTQRPRGEVVGLDRSPRMEALRWAPERLDGRAMRADGRAGQCRIKSRSGISSSPAQ